MVHGRAGDVERETGDLVVHQDAKVVAEIGARDAQGPHARDDKHISDNEEGGGGVLDGVGGEDVEGGLVAQRLLVKVVASDSDREDDDGQEVAAVPRIAAKELGEDSVVVFYSAELDLGRGE